jgi:excisionase family DNA binding protein
MDDPLLTIPQAAARLGLDRTRVWRLVRDGRIPAQRVGPLWLIRQSDLDAFADEPRPPGRPPWRKPPPTE